MASSASVASDAGAGANAHQVVAPVRSLLNAPRTLVVEAIEGFLACNPHLRRLDGGGDIKVRRSHLIEPTSYVLPYHAMLDSSTGCLPC